MTLKERAHHFARWHNARLRRQRVRIMDGRWL